MPGRHIDATMDGVALSTIGGIIVREVHEDAPTVEITNGERPGGYGQLVLGKKRQSLKVAIECLITEIHNLATRTAKAEALAKWANGSVLELSNHPGRVLNGYLSGEPTLGEVRDYNSALRVEFTADQVPYWEDKTATTATDSGTEESGTLTVPGSVKTPVMVTVKPSSSTVTSFSVTVGGQTIALTDISVGTLQTLYIDRDERDNLRIRRGSTSYMSYRTAASADDLMVSPGTVSYSFTASAAVNVTFSFKGRWA